MNKFDKVKFEEFCKGANIDPNWEESKNTYDNIIMPQRKTLKSAGYDLHSPVGFTLQAGESIKIATGLKVQIDNLYALFIIPRSSLGFKYRLQLDNSIGLIDEDYFNNIDNEGHIFCKITNDSKTYQTLKINAGDAIAQAIFFSYGITIDDDPGGLRIGGVGSTNKS